MSHRGQVMKGIVRDMAGTLSAVINRIPTPKLTHKILHKILHKEPEPCARSPRTGEDNLAPGLAESGMPNELVNQQHQRSSSLESPVNPVSETYASSSSADSSTDADTFLRNLPFPTRAVATVHLWPKVDMNEALLWQGSVLYKEPEGKWVACPEEFIVKIEEHDPVHRTSSIGV